MTAEVTIWSSLRQLTIARVGLERTGNALRLADLLAFQLAHARARDAVHGSLDVSGLAATLAPLQAVAVASLAKDRAQYLRRPDLGRRLHPESHAALLAGPFDGVFVIADGLSAAAVNDRAAPVVHAMMALLPNWRFAPIVIAKQARVAIGDDIGHRLASRLSIVLIGERPGLSVPQSMGIYITYEPRPGRSDAERNCISNIHANGLSVGEAARKAAWLMTEAVRRRLSGVNLKEAAPDLPLLAR